MQGEYTYALAEFLMTNFIITVVDGGYISFVNVHLWLVILNGIMLQNFKVIQEPPMIIWVTEFLNNITGFRIGLLWK